MKHKYIVLALVLIHLLYAIPLDGNLIGGTDTASLGEHSMAATGNYSFAIPIETRFIRISAKGTGTVTASSMTIDAVLGTTA